MVKMDQTAITTKETGATSRLVKADKNVQLNVVLRLAALVRVNTKMATKHPIAVLTLAKVDTPNANNKLFLSLAAVAKFDTTIKRDVLICLTL